ncbi:sensor domain-containing diguanylate cyclase [Microbulbifer sp. OS29]|uniref:diguanylate cyclase n=1 Tax=Microbulbifer okhotskensis TaxID=2926617 RepID=A0A9X2EM14_9GAMM|nr:diguanylate cyclase [Microbulbifer okhotskensis]MCO1334729.1 sensor domain-containing diguanylate cyclase [Microbulbifer okhotskensis]
MPQVSQAHPVLEVTSLEAGSKLSGLNEIWHDVTGMESVSDAVAAHKMKYFVPLDSAGSTGLKSGAFWSHFVLKNSSSSAVTVSIEYIDNQLMGLMAFSRLRGGTGPYVESANLSISQPFSARAIKHHRFAFPITIPPSSSKEMMVKFDAGTLGVVFPSMRVWTPSQLQERSKTEAILTSFLFGGYFLMAILALIGAITMRENILYLYSVYSAAKIWVWGTLLGYTHQYLIQDNFHWSYLSLSSAAAILTGILFSRCFLETAKYTPRMDYVLQLIMLNGVLLIICVVFQWEAMADILMVLALFLYPGVVIVAMVRWRQGNSAAAVFALGWATLVLGLLVQAMRDLGFVVHNPINYYWPPVASFVEMLAIMIAISLMVQRLRRQKEVAERKYLQHLEASRTDLEYQVQLRTQELEFAKVRAEQEARTDPLTGVFNRRCFFEESGSLVRVAIKNDLPLYVLMLDLDNFKLVNDIHGHLIGDQALCATTRVISQHVRDVDIFGRIGGEEFALVLSASTEGALAVAQRIHRDIAKIVIKSAVGQVQFTASIGIAGLQGEEGILELMQRADAALYQAKRAGRNRIIECAET